MKIGNCYVELIDDGTLDTVLQVSSKYGTTECRFDTEYASHYRDENGDLLEEDFRDLAYEAFEDHLDQLEI